MINVLIIEDQSPHFKDLKFEFEKQSESFEVYPQNDNDTDTDLNNRGHLIDILLSGDPGFESVIKFHDSIDLFIVDVTLYPASGDKIGIDFLNYLKKKNYRNLKFNFIIITQHNLENIQEIKLDFDPSKQYISKNKWGDVWPSKVIDASFNLFDLTVSVTRSSQKNNKSFSFRDWWILLPDNIEKNIIHRINLLILYSFIILTGVFSIHGIYKETFQNVSSASDVHLAISSTKLLEYIEHIFLYLLPIFIVFSFLSYYKSTIEIKLTGGNTRNIDHDGAMKSLNNSKLILLMSLLSFTIIKILENIFENNVTDITTLIAYGIFLLLLMIFILLHQKSYHKFDKF